MLKIDKIYNMDCLQGMNQIENKSIDFILTSPPFKDEDIEGDYWLFYDKFMNQMERITKEYAFIFQSSTKMWEMCHRYRKPFHIFMWIKPEYMGKNHRYEPIFVYSFDSTTFKWRNMGQDVYPYAVIKKERWHPYFNPLNLYIAILKNIPEGKIILDPFMGSGTTALACRRSNKHFIGFEINKEYYQKSIKRLNNSELPLKIDMEVNNDKIYKET